MSDQMLTSFPKVIFNHQIWDEKHNISTEALIQEFTSENSAERERIIAGVKRGEPAPYLTNHFYFRNRCFFISSKAYITDPEATYLVDVVQAFGSALVSNGHSKRPQVAEFGIGGGMLSISLALENPDFNVIGFDIDTEALTVANENQKKHLSDIEIFESDFFRSWPHDQQPDIIFADPPWGSREDLYDDERDATYYDHMPRLSAYPQNGRIGLHNDLLKAIQQRNWSSIVIINLGIIPENIFSPLLSYFKEYQIYQPTDEINILAGFLNRKTNS